jgi:hypothetical protein
VVKSAMDKQRILIAGIEILDFGYPQNTETETLKMYITTEGVKSEKNVVRLFLQQARCAKRILWPRRSSLTCS